MAKQKLFDEPFDEGTIVKLELYKNYLKEWIPVFNSRPKPITNVVNVFDFFSGVGCDPTGKYGSPLIAVDVITKAKYINRKDVRIHLHLNDYDSNKLNKLKQNIVSMGYNPALFDIHYYNKDAVTLFHQLQSEMQDAANLIFFDQYGIKYVDKTLFQQVARKTMTDFIFFVSSATYNRFADNSSITSTIQISPKLIKNSKSSHIHNLVADAYKQAIPNDITYYLAPFSIQKKKGKAKNIYGLIFGSRHPLGIEKFLTVSWKQDVENGTANFDIEDTQIKKSQLSLFTGKTTPTKKEIFENSLEEEILKGILTTDQDIVAYMLNHGFIRQHVIPVIESLKAQKKIKYEGRLSLTSGILYKKKGDNNYKQPTKIKLL
ncbi:MAG: three-Cys-motif partner protein TcmP [Kordia sp.]|uniref:three-Cys-motif partner protein TcmP n=1 Tax=Kordia sp. TaxID=1965332 RepID=UPI00385AD4C0